MSPYRGSLVLAGCLTLILSASVKSEPPGAGSGDSRGGSGNSRPQLGGVVDAYGDPLPHGALARMGTLRFRPGSPVVALAFSPDGKILASQGSYGKVHLWDAANGRELRQLQVDPNVGTVVSFFFSADSKVLYLKDSGWSLLAWEVESGKKLQKNLEEFDATVGFCGISSDGKTIAIGKNDGKKFSYHLWDVESGKEICQLQGKKKTPDKEADKEVSTFHALAFSRDGKYAAAGAAAVTPGFFLFGGTTRFKICAWDAATGKELWENVLGQQEVASQVLFAPNGKVLVWRNGAGNVLHLLDAATGKEIRQINSSDNQEVISSFVFTADSKSLVIANAGSLQSVDVATGKEEKRWETHDAISSLVLAPDGKTLAFGDSSTIHLFDTAAWKKLQPIGGHLGPIALVALSSDGKTLLSTGMDHTVRTWDQTTGKEVRRFDFSDLLKDGSTLTGASFSPDGKILAATAGKPDPNTGQLESGPIHLWETDTGKKVRKFTLPGVSGSSLTFSQDGKLLASGCSDGSVCVYDLIQGKEFCQIKVNNFKNMGAVLGLFNMDLAFAPDGKTLVTREPAQGLPADEDDDAWPQKDYTNETTIRVWEIATRKQRHSFSLKRSDTSLFGLDPMAFLLGILAPVDPNLNPDPYGPLSMVFSPRGQTAAFGGNFTMQLYDLKRGKEIRRFGGLRLNVRTAVFSPDGNHLAAGTFDGAVRIWEVDTGTVVCCFPAHQSAISSLVYSADGKTLITASADSTALVWDVAGLIEEARPAAVTDDKLESLWLALAGEDAAKAGQAMQTLANDPKQGVSFLKKMLKPAPAAPAPRVIEQWIGQLDSDQFNEREKAMQALEKLERMAEPALRQAFAKPSSLEVRRRLERLLEKLEGPVTSPEALQALRALEILEQLGTAEARGVLEDLARGAAEAGLTQEAKAVLERLAKRQP